MYQIFTNRDLEQFKAMGVDAAVVESQVDRFKTGFPFLEIVNFATNGKGIVVVDSSEHDKYKAIWDEYCKTEHSVVKFVPASGAASRMFKDLFEFLQGESLLPEKGSVRDFFNNIQKFAFFEDLNKMCVETKGKDVNSLIVDRRYADLLEAFLLKDGLNYGGLPKGLLKFHAYKDKNRTPVEEHLVEASQYARTSDGKAVLHFTVSPEHRSLFQSLVDLVKVDYEKILGVKFDVSFSEQKKKTDTLAVDENNEPFRDGEDLLFRPGGHGALIENLNDLSSDVIFIKNIDNVVPDKLKGEETFYKEMLAGYLVDIQSRVFQYLNLIDSGIYSRDQLLEILNFLQDDLNVKNPETKYLEDAELVLYLQRKLNRPIRVCGMVKNVGEAGGGPFFAVNEDGTVSLQILESSQIDLADPQKKVLFTSGTHFNPVDIVCAVKDYKGEKFDLIDYIDQNTGFISEKTKEGKALKALELPGLWNGAMSDWNTIFVEVPLETFNPVKSVNDLLRKEHLS